jgi:hypothetical protein
MTAASPEADTVVPSFALAEIDREGGKRKFAAGIQSLVRIVKSRSHCEQNINAVPVIRVAMRRKRTLSRPTHGPK